MEITDIKGRTFDMILKNGTLKLIYEINGAETYSDFIDCNLKETTSRREKFNKNNSYIGRTITAMVDYNNKIDYHSVVGCEITDFDSEYFGVFKVESCQKNNFVGNVKFELTEFNGE